MGADIRSIYEKLSPHLEVVKQGVSVMEVYGCYPPKRNGRNKLEDWPLSHWHGPGPSPLVMKWVAKSETPPTFDQFIRAYKIRIPGAPNEQ